ncbi:MAG: methyltransferase domain-containing protein [Verrucomicrobia bacterium]|nr:methyltransferase domain-containing protein [Verrucomicrobiota bacterium]
MTLESRPSYSGLVAEWYDRLLVSEQHDIAYYSERAAQVEGPILELACGTGRILLPICRMGKDVDGIDVSGQMLAICRDKLAREGLSANLYEQDCAGFSTGRRYGMIFVAGGSFQLIADLEQVRSCLARVRSHLDPGGLFVLDVCQFGLESSDAWKDGRTAQDGREEFRCYHRSRIDPKDQVMALTSKYEVHTDGELVRTQEHTMSMRWYEGDQLPDELRAAGFSRVETHAETIINTHAGTLAYSAWV